MMAYVSKKRLMGLFLVGVCGTFALLLCGAVNRYRAQKLFEAPYFDGGMPVTASGKLYTRSLVVDGVRRRYAIYIPNDLGRTPLPLILELHGGGVYIEDMTGESGHKTPYKLWMNLADREKFIVVYPEGLNGSYDKPTWNDCRANSLVSSTADDVHFITVLIDKIASDYNIDATRIYVSGTSNGGLMALRLAVELSDRVAAVVTVGAAMPDVAECGAPVNPISVMFINGTADNHLPYEGGILSNPPNPDHGSVYSVDVSVRMWVDFDQAATTPTVYEFPNRDKGDESTVTRYTYAHGLEDTEVVLYKVTGGGHSAPSIAERYSWLFEHYFGKQNHDIEMVWEAWHFFQDKRLGTVREAQNE